MAAKGPFWNNSLFPTSRQRRRGLILSLRNKLWKQFCCTSSPWTKKAWGPHHSCPLRGTISLWRRSHVAVKWPLASSGKRFSHPRSLCGSERENSGRSLGPSAPEADSASAGDRHSWRSSSHHCWLNSQRDRFPGQKEAHTHRHELQNVTLIIWALVKVLELSPDVPEGSRAHTNFKSFYNLWPIAFILPSTP